MQHDGMMKRILAAAAFALLIPALPAAACSCVGYETAEAQYEQASLVFIGHVLDTGPEKQERSLWDIIAVWKPKPSPYSVGWVTTFQVDDMLKGPDVGTIQLTHMGPAASSMCGVGFKPLDHGVFIGYGSPSEGYSVSLCTMPQFGDAEFIAAAN